MLLFLFDGVLLFRLAERRFCALLFHDPPRITRLEPEAAPVFGLGMLHEQPPP
jgi:hypothetical protein